MIIALKGISVKKIKNKKEYYLPDVGDLHRSSKAAEPSWPSQRPIDHNGIKELMPDR